MLDERLIDLAAIVATGVMWLLVALSLVSIAIIAERWWYFRHRRADVARLGTQLGDKLRAGAIADAERLLRESGSVEGAVVADALRWHAHGATSVSEMVDSGLRQSRKQVETGLTFLGTVAANAPFIGLFGTVLGIVTAFHELGQDQASAAMGTVMNGIAEALIATALGILVAIPAVIAYNNFQRRATEIEDNALSLAAIIRAHMHSTLAPGDA